MPSFEPRDRGGDTLVAESSDLRVQVAPSVGGSILSIFHRRFGVEVLGRPPWVAVAAPLGTIAARDEDEWLTWYRGGWQTLFPNAGDSSDHDGRHHGFHGEASVAQWSVASTAPALRLVRRMESVPVEMTRTISIDNDVVIVDEEAVVVGESSINVIWCQHPAFGSDLLSGPIVIETGARWILDESDHGEITGPEAIVHDGDEHGPEMFRPMPGSSAMAYLTDFESPWVSIRREDGQVGAVVSWDPNVYSFAWLWVELGGTKSAPWGGQTRLIGVEPSSSWPGSGIGDVARRGGRLIRLNPREPMSSSVRLHVFEPQGPTIGIDNHGRVTS